MPPINFPDNPTQGQEYSFQGKVWRYDGQLWTGVTPPTLGFDIAGTIPPGPWVPPGGVIPGQVYVAGGEVTGFPDGDAQEGDGLLFNKGVWINIGPLRGPRGLQGDTGATGDKGNPGQPGPEGAAGTDGISGLNGMDGRSPTVIVEDTITVPANQPARVRNVGTPFDVRLIFEIPGGFCGTTGGGGDTGGGGGGVIPPLPPGDYMAFSPERFNFGQEITFNALANGQANVLYNDDVFWYPPADANAAMIWWQNTQRISHNGGGVLTTGSIPSLRCYTTTDLTITNATFPGGGNKASMSSAVNYVMEYSAGIEANRYEIDEALKFDTITFTPGSTITFNFQFRKIAANYVKLQTFRGRLLVLPLQVTQAQLQAMRNMQLSDGPYPPSPSNPTDAEIRAMNFELADQLLSLLATKAATEKQVDTANAASYDTVLAQVATIRGTSYAEPQEKLDAISALNTQLDAI